MKDEYLYGHMVHEYYVERVRDAARARDGARAKVRTRTDVLRLRDDVRRRLARCFGPMPPRTPLKPRVTGVLDRPTFRIEKLIYESRPGFPVTANLYIPARGDRPLPAVLGACGHAMEAKAYVNYQAFAQGLARIGYVVLIYDPISQGERLQYLGLPKRDRPGGMCDDHNMMGNQMHLCGEFFGLWRAWDGIRGLDYLLSRPEVDPARVGVTGNSGGGTLTTYLTALDARFTMAAPSCFVTRYLSNLENELPADSEQIPPGILAEGLDLADFFVAHIPRPTLFLGQNNDFFDRRGLDATYRELRRLYAILGAEDSVQLFMGPGSHSFSVESREAMYRFFNRHANLTASAREERPLRTEKPELLRAAPRGQVHYLAPRTVFDFTSDKALELAARRKPIAAAALAAAIRRRLALPERSGPPHYRVLRTRWPDRKGQPLQATFAVETEPCIRVILHAFRRGEELFHLPPCPAATIYVSHLSSEREVRAGRAPDVPLLFAVDVRGFGQLTERTCNDPDFFAPYGHDYLYASHGLMLAEPYGGRRVHDLLSVLDLMQSVGCRDVHLVARGLGAIWATFAACLHPVVRRVTLHNALLSYHELTQAPAFTWPLSSFVFGVLEEFDLPDCLRELSQRKQLCVIEPWDAEMRPWKRGALRAHLKSLRLDALHVRP